MQFCFAEGEPEEDIDVYFNQEPEQTTQLDGYLEYNQPAAEKEEDSIELSPTTQTGINYTKPKSFGSKSLIGKKPTFHPMQEELGTASKFSTHEYDIGPVSGSFSRRVGKFTVGTTYNSALSSARVNYSTGIFTRYENKHFALNTAFSKKTSDNYDAFSDSFSFAPELKLTNRLSLLDVMQMNANQLNKSNEVVLRYTPHFKKYADDVQFELGAGQSFYENAYLNSSVRFSTRFKL